MPMYVCYPGHCNSLLLYPHYYRSIMTIRKFYRADHFESFKANFQLENSKLLVILLQSHSKIAKTQGNKYTH